MKLEILKTFSKNIQILNFMTIRPVGAEFSIRTGGRKKRRGAAISRLLKNGEWGYNQSVDVV
jgi:hypothetical protein